MHFFTRIDLFFQQYYNEILLSLQVILKIIEYFRQQADAFPKKISIFGENNLENKKY